MINPVVSPDFLKSPLVSIVMLAYNHGLHIQDAINGVIAQQTDFPIELLIGEDRSTDNTLAIAREFEKAHPEKVRIVTSEANVGMLENLRRLEAAARGKYVAYCEADDYWHDIRKLQNQVAFMEANPDYSLVHTEYRTKHIASGRVVPNAARQPNNLNDADAFNELLSGRRLVLTLTACVRRSELDGVLADCPECYDPRFLMGDTQRWLELARRGKVKCLHEVTSTHLLISESASQSRNPKRVLRFILSAKDVLDYYINKYGCPHETRVATLSRANIGVLACAYEAGEFGVAKQALEEFRTLGFKFNLRPNLYCYGSRSPLRKLTVRPLLAALTIFEKIKRKASRLFNAS